MTFIKLSALLQREDHISVRSGSAEEWQRRCLLALFLVGGSQPWWVDEATAAGLRWIIPEGSACCCDHVVAVQL
jgi:hypothetical protein